MSDETTEQTAMERLRALLDERGVKYKTDDTQVSDTEWYYVTKLRDGYHDRWTYEEPPDCDLLVSYQYDIGAEDAIAATLGNGTLTAEQVEQAVRRNIAFCECDKEDVQAIADELNATLGNRRAERTCENVNAGDSKANFICSECGLHIHKPSIGRSYLDKNGKRWYATTREHGFNYCPNCGAKVVES